MDYKELKEEEILCWYDCPLIETLRDNENNIYIAYNNSPDEILTLVSEELLIKMFEHQITVYDCFMAGSKKWKWDRDKLDYVEIPDFDPDDLVNQGIYFKEICYFEYDKNYCETLKEKLNGRQKSQN